MHDRELWDRNAGPVTDSYKMDQQNAAGSETYVHSDITPEQGTCSMT